MIKVSIIVPVYNAEQYIERCMQCLMGQTLKETELILVDDCSTDGSGKFLDGWREQYPDKIKVIHLIENRGAGGARNQGVELAQGEYIGFMDCDDVIDTTMYEKLYQKASVEGCDVVDCGYYEEASRNEVLSYGDNVTGELDEEKRSEMIVGTGYAVTKIFRTSLLKDKACRIRENVIYEDLDFLIQVTLLAQRAGNVKEILYYYKNNQQSSSKTGNEQKKFKDMLAAMEAIELIKNQYAQEEKNKTEQKRNVTMAMEYAMLSCFSCAIGICLLNQDNQTFPLIENIRHLKKISYDRWQNWRENDYLQKNMTEENKQILVWFEDLKL